MTYREYLKANGASEADIAILDTPIAQSAYTKMEARVAEEARLRGIAETDRTNYQKWYEEQALPAYTDMQNKMVTSTAELARAKAAVLAAQEQGLTEIAKNLGWTEGGDKKVETKAPDAIDTSKYVTTDTLRTFMEEAGNGLAGLQDMVLEHSSLFPNQKLNVSDLRREAVAAHKNIVQFWTEKYNVPAARQARADADQAAHDAKLREEGATAERAKYADLANPSLRPGVPSHSPFTQRTDRDRTKQPWETGDRTNDRIAGATRRLIEQQNQKAN